MSAPRLSPALLLTVIAAAGCGGSSSSRAPATGAVNPNAREVSPAGDIPDNQVYVRFTPPGGGFSVKVPEGWSRSTAQGATTFTDKLNSVRVQSAAASGPVSAKGLARQLATTVRGYRPGSAGTVQRAGQRVVRVTYLADAPRNAVTGKAGLDAVERYEYVRGARRVTLTLSGPKGADNVDPWRIISDSVRFGA